MRPLALPVVLVLALGCSSAPDPIDRDAATGGGDAGTPGDGGGGPCPGCSDDLYPIGLGMRWDYVIARGSRPGCATSVSSTVVSMGTDPDGATYYTRELSCGSYPSSDVKREGDTIWIRSTGTSAWYRYLVLPPTEGAEFAAGGASGASYRWTSAGSVTVPAGTYSGCWRREQVGYDVSEIYCPGVGMVSADFHAWGQDEGYDLTGRGP